MSMLLFILVVGCGLFEWMQICAGLLPFVYNCIGAQDPPGGCNPIFNPSFVCMSKARNIISISICHGFMFNEWRWDIMCYVDLNWLIPKISACWARIWTSYSVEQADIFQYQSYSHSDDMIIILKSNINMDTSIGFDICIFAGKITWFKIHFPKT